jgi:hypothetical protein
MKFGGSSHGGITSARTKLFGVSRGGGALGGIGPIEPNMEKPLRHTYLRLAPELRASVYGPNDATAPALSGSRHPVLAGFDETDTLPFGGYLPNIVVEPDVTVLATHIAAFPMYPPETAWMREPRSTLPAITARDGKAGSRLVWFAADLDRCFARDQSFEHGKLIANAVRWALARGAAVELSGTQGLVSPTLYQQPGRQVLHLNNRLIYAPVPGRQSELIALGPVTVSLPLAGALPPQAVSLRVSGTSVPTRIEDDRLVFDVPAVRDHEVIAVDWR